MLCYDGSASPCITTQGYIAAAVFTGGMTLFYNLLLIVGISATPHLSFLIPAVTVTVIQFVAFIILIGCYVSFRACPSPLQKNFEIWAFRMAIFRCFEKNEVIEVWWLDIEIWNES